jgi:acetyl esterase
MHYPIDKELHSLYLHKLPENVRLFSVMNGILQMYKCESDDKVKVTVHETPGYQNEMIKTYVIEPKNVEKVLPCLVFFHGGGFLLKASEAHYQIAKEYAERIPCKVVLTDYRLAPKYPFPIPVEDCFSTYKWVLDHVDMLGIDKNKIIIGGDSAGGNLATAVTLMVRDRHLPIPAALLLIYPATDRRMITESMKKYTDTPVWNTKLSKMMWDAYLGEQIPEHIEYASPIEATSFEQFPPVYMEVAEYDCLRDEGILLYERLKDENINAEIHEIKNACHSFETVMDSSITRACMDRRFSWFWKNI